MSGGQGATPTSVAVRALSIIGPALFCMALCNTMVPAKAMFLAVLQPLLYAAGTLTILAKYRDDGSLGPAHLLLACGPVRGPSATSSRKSYLTSDFRFLVSKPSLLLSSIVLVPVAIASSALTPGSFSSPFYLFGGAVLSIASQYTLLSAAKVLEGPEALANLLLARSCITIVCTGAWRSDLWLLALMTGGVQAITHFTAPSGFTDDERELELGEASRGPIWRWLSGLCHSLVVGALGMWALQSLRGPTSLDLRLQRGLLDLSDSPRTLDVVISHFDEALDDLSELMTSIKTRMWYRNIDIRWIMYSKRSDIDVDILRIASGVDQVIGLPNSGRESGTFLQHIMRNYNATLDPARREPGISGLADHTLFTQAVCLVSSH